MRKRVFYMFSFLVGTALAFGFSTRAWGEEFYKGKTLRFVVGFSAGGGFDSYTRAIARHMGRHIPGNPTTVVENMTGAGSILAASYMYNRAEPDGLTIGNWIGGLVQQQIFGATGVQFDARKFEWVGVPVVDHAACALTKTSGITSLDKWLASKRPIKLGGVGPGGQASDVPRILKAALGLPIQVIDGYKGTANVRLAAESGELDGGCWNWASVKATWKAMVESEGVRIVVQAMPKKHPDLLKVPNAINYAKTDEARQLLKYGIHDPAVISRFYSLPPGTPKERVQVLQKAFMDTMNDPRFLADAGKSKLDIDPTNGETVKELVAGFFKMEPSLVEKLKDILVPKT